MTYLKQLRSLHSIVHVPIAEGAIGTSLPFLFIDEGELYLPALAWARVKLLDQSVSPATLGKAVSAIGRFYDFYMLEKGGPALRPEDAGILLKQFYEARRYGLSSLGWKPVLISTVGDDVRAISEFTDWCNENLRHIQVNPKETVPLSELKAGDRRNQTARSEHRKNWDLLYHLMPATLEGRGYAHQRGFNPESRRRQRSTTNEKCYPPDKVMAAIGASSSIRDMLFNLLIFMGGLRISEPVHIFATDISINPDGTARVVLGHPQDGTYSWVGKDRGRRTSSRAAFLAEKYGLGPRNKLGRKHPLHAGWKGMMFDDAKRHQSEVYWLREDASRLFGQLHIQYMATVRSKLPDSHPYYFVNLKNDSNFGAPLTLSNMTKAFRRVAIKVGLSPSQPGVNPHGGRHFYGYYCASVLRLPLETTQKLMHHRSISSTQIYYGLSNAAVRDEIKKAQEQGDARSVNFLPPLLDLMEVKKYD